MKSFQLAYVQTGLAAGVNSVTVGIDTIASIAFPIRVVGLDFRGIKRDVGSTTYVAISMLGRFAVSNDDMNTYPFLSETLVSGSKLAFQRWVSVPENSLFECEYEIAAGSSIELSGQIFFPAAAALNDAIDCRLTVYWEEM